MENRLVVDISKCISNPVRLKILNWLRQPEDHFPPHNAVKHFNDGGLCNLYSGKDQLIAIYDFHLSINDGKMWPTHLDPPRQVVLSSGLILNATRN